ncbi:LuxR C-terminal-related transcriptional regulator [Adhaeribacter aquaticus]|uniref:LuxR C-terminal-related transcriptional regulator n=1 Tax=Adhaeribacter aquaticus TaxID=299567 RepID=UPI0004046C16|nr:LuxR C-terminal-related transcriptional regulator [Adhaeribacter aquaticus]
MTEQSSIEEIFFKYLLQYKFEEEDLDYSVLQKHTAALQALSDIGNSGISIFDISKRQILFYSSNYGKLLGYNPSDYERKGQHFFDAKIHPDDKLKLSYNSITTFKLFDNFTNDEKLNHKQINEYRILNAQNQYIRLVEQHQILELDKKGQIWLLMSVVDISPNQDDFEGINSQIFNFRTGNIISLETPQKAQIGLTKRETEILQLVKGGYLSKEISNKLSISLHTVNTHRQRFLEKLGANNSIEAVIFASKLGLLG